MRGDPQCPTISGTGVPGMARSATERDPAGSLFLRRLHAASADRGDRLPEQGGGLHDPVQCRVRDDAHDRRRYQTSGRADRAGRGPAQLGPERYHSHIHCIFGDLAELAVPTAYNR